MKTAGILAIGLVAASCLAGTTDTFVPRIISHQGQIAVNGAPFIGTGLFRFALVDSAGTKNYWVNATADKAGVPGKSVSLAVANGLYSVLLGDTTITNMAEIPAAVFTNESVWLRVWFDDGTTGLQQLTPDQRLSAVGYAFAANALNGMVKTTTDTGDLAAAGNITAGGSFGFADATTQSTSCTGDGTPVRYIDVSGSSDYPYTLQVAGSGNVYHFSALSGFSATVKVTLPSAQTTKGRRLTIIRTNANIAMTINTTNSEKIKVYYDATFQGTSFNMLGLGAEFVSDGASWLLLQYWSTP